MRSFFTGKKSPGFFSFLGIKIQILLGVVLTALFVIGALFFNFKTSTPVSQEQENLPIVEQVAEGDSRITETKTQTLSEDLDVLDQNIADLEDRYREAIVDAWVWYQQEPDNFVLINELRNSLSRMNVPYIYQTFHSELLDVLLKKQEALLTGDIYLLQKVERDIAFLERSSFL